MKSPVLIFTFPGSDNRLHDCRIEFDWLGSERYYVDDHLVMKQWSLLGATAEFTAHGVTVLIRSRLEKREAVTEVFLDGVVAHPNLMSESNREFEAKLKRFGLGPSKPLTLKSWLGKVAVWAVLAYSFFALFKWLQSSAA